MKAVPAQRANARGLRSDVLTSYALRGASLLSSLLVFPLLFRGVGAEQYGLWLLLTSSLAFFSLDLGLGTSLLRYSAEAHADADADALNRLTASGLAFFTLLGAVSATVYAVCFWRYLEHLDVGGSAAATAVLLVAVGNLAVGLPLGVFRTVLCGQGRYGLVNLLLAAGVVARTVGLLVAVPWLHAGLVGIALVDGGVTLCVGLAMIVACRRLLPGFAPRPRAVDLGLLRRIAPYSGRVFVLNVTALVILQTDSLVISAFLPLGAVAVYGGGLRLYQTSRELLNAFTGPLIPSSTVSARHADVDRLRRLFVRGTAYANLLAAVVAVPCGLLAGPLLRVWVGPEMNGAAASALVLMVSLVLNSNHLVAVSMATGTGDVRTYARLHALWAVANVVLSVTLVQRIGLVGVALGTLLPLVVLEPLYVRAALRAYQVPVGLFLREAVLPAAGPAAAATIAVLALVPDVLFADVLATGARDPGGIAGLLDIARAAAVYAAAFGLAALWRPLRSPLLRRTVPGAAG